MECSKCHIDKTEDQFPKAGQVCKSCQNKQQREYRANNNNKNTHKYEKSHKGFLMRLYRNMDSRIHGIQKAKYHLYKGKYLLPREEFYNWAINNQSFYDLFDVWEKSNYDRKLTPSVDRIDSSIGYFLNNMEWVTHSENSRRGAVSKYGKK